MFWLFVHFLLYGTSGFLDETLAAYADGELRYQLVEMDGAEIPGQISLVFPDMWRVEARTPCHRYSFKILVPYPWFELSKGKSEAYSCIQLPLEDAFVQNLRSMNLSEVHGDILILSNDAGAEMEFRVER